jgi:hypothetical protein
MPEGALPKCLAKKTRESSSKHLYEIGESVDQVLLLALPAVSLYTVPSLTCHESYHWSLIVGPKTETKGSQGTRYHAKEEIGEDGMKRFQFEEVACSLLPTRMLLVRVLIAKVEDSERLAGVMRQIPIGTRDQGWNCVTWVRDVLERLQREEKILGRKIIDWQKVRDAAMEYCQRKRDQHRFDGKGQFDPNKVPTYGLLEGKETQV